MVFFQLPPTQALESSWTVLELIPQEVVFSLSRQRPSLPEQGFERKGIFIQGFIWDTESMPGQLQFVPIPTCLPLSHEEESEI
jgi:hypothetical protein